MTFSFLTQAGSPHSSTATTFWRDETRIPDCLSPRVVTASRELLIAFLLFLDLEGVWLICSKEVVNTPVESASLRYSWNYVEIISFLDTIQVIKKPQTNNFDKIWLMQSPLFFAVPNSSMSDLR